MRRVVAVGLLLAAVVAVLGSASGSASSAPASTGAAPTSPPALQTLQTCLSDPNRPLRVLFLVDESGSLKQSDPQNRRVEAIQSALAGLDEVRTFQSGDRPRKVEVLLAKFSTGYGEVSDGWRSLSSPGNLQSLRSDAEGYARLNGGQDTDYGVALVGAIGALAKREAQSGTEDACQLLMFFTDGKYSLPNGGEDAAVRDLCRSGSTLDVLRGNDVVMVTVALNEGDAFGVGDVNLLKRMTEGSDGTQRCGAKGSPKFGFLVTVPNADELLFGLGNLLDPTLRVIPCSTGEPVCSFSVPAGATGFTLVTQAEEDDYSLAITPPDEQPILFPPTQPASTTFSGAGARVTVVPLSPRAKRVVAEFTPDPSRGGEWKIGFSKAGRPQGSGRYTVKFAVDLVPGLVQTPRLQRGESSPLDIGIFGPGSTKPVETPLFDGADVDLVVSGCGSSENSFDLPDPPTPDGPSRWTARVEVPDDTKASSARIAVTVTPSGPNRWVGVRTWRSPTCVPIALPASYPSVTPAELVLGSIKGKGATSGKMTVAGSADWDGCVWFSPSDASLPNGDPVPVEVLSGDGTPAPTTEGSCLAIPKGQARVIDIRVAPGKAADGRVNGLVKVSLSSRSPNTDVQQIEVPVRFSMTVEPNTGLALAILVVLLLLGIAFPVFVIHALNRFTAYFDPGPGTLRYLFLDVEVQDGRMRQRTEAAGSDAAAYEAFALVDAAQGERRVREMQIGELSLRAHASGWIAARRLTLLAGPFGSVQASDAGVIAGAEVELRAFPRNGAHEVPLALPGTWVFWPEQPVTEAALSSDEPIAGRLALFVRPAEGDIDAGRRLLMRAEIVVPGRLGELVGVTPEDGDGSTAGGGPGGDAGGEPPWAPPDGERPETPF